MGAKLKHISMIMSLQTSLKEKKKSETHTAVNILLEVTHIPEQLHVFRTPFANCV